MWQVIGQDRAISLLQHSMQRGSLAHAYLLVGLPHVGKMSLALNLAQAVNCEVAESPCGECNSCRKIAQGKHADVQIIGLGSNGNLSEARPRAEIGIAQIREMQHSANLPPFEGRCRVFIINGAELLSTEAANCLLKTLEEPAAGVIFILLTVNESILPATVVSRCQRIELPPLTTTEAEAALNNHWGVDPERARLLSRLCHGCLGWAVSAAVDDSLLQQRAERLERLHSVSNADFEKRFNYTAELVTQFNQNRELVWEILDLWLNWWRDLLLVKTGCSDNIINVDMLDALVDEAMRYSVAQITGFIKSIQAAKEQLKLNANPRLVLEVLMLSVPSDRG
jgi:DNA polymerase-3 subunit delta'